MFTTFKEIESYVLSQNMKKRIALANAHDEPALSAVVNAKRRGVVEGTLIGKKAEIVQMLHDMGESEADYEIIDFDGEELESAKIAIKLVKEGKADIPMKGILLLKRFWLCCVGDVFPSIQSPSPKWQRVWMEYAAW